MAYIDFGSVLGFAAASAAAAQNVAEKLHAKWGGAEWFVGASAGSDEGGPYAFVTARSGVSIPSLPDAIDGVPIRILVQEPQPTELIIERTPYPYDYMPYPFVVGGGGRRHGGGHHGHHGP